MDAIVQPGLLVQNFKHVGTPPPETTLPPRPHDLSMSTKITAIMALHDQQNKALPPSERHFYIHKRNQLIANGSARSRVYDDGLIKLGRFLVLSDEEITEVQRYLRFITGHGDMGAKTMIRLVCRSRADQQARQPHRWPENTVVMVNGKAVPISPVYPLPFLHANSRMSLATSRKRNLELSITFESRFIRFLFMYMTSLSQLTCRVRLVSIWKCSRSFHSMK